jgi:hypothetical protein
MFGRKSAEPRPIVDLDMQIGDGWYDIEFDDPNWADEVARTVAETPEQRDALQKHLAIMQDSHANLAAMGAGVWVLLRPDVPERSICTLSYGVSPKGDATPDAYEQMLASDDGHREPGVRFDVVRTWQVDIDAGVAVGGYNLIGYADLMYDGVASEQRTLFGVFPTGSSDVIEVTFKTLVNDAFDNFVEQTMAWVATLEVELGK